jgi:thiol:disulfide interchange protein DsbG
LKTLYRHWLIAAAVSIFVLAGADIAKAQEALPDLPAPIQNLVDEGAQIRYLGREFGFDSWLTVKNGQEQYFYVLPDGKAFVMGVLFDNKGKLVTVDQVQRLREKGDTMLDTLADENTGFETNQSAAQERFEFKTPAERLYHDVENSNWISLGEIGAPIAYSFVDPQCPHCHALIENIKPELERGRVQLRIIPVGFKEDTLAQAAFLLAAPNPQERWMKHIEGDETALPARSDINQQGVQRNLAIMQSWKLTATPLIVYRGKDGEIKIVRGQPKDLPGMISDLGARS